MVQITLFATILFICVGLLQKTTHHLQVAFLVVYSTN